MKINFEKTSELKNLLKVGTEHTVGYQGSTRKQGIVADSISSERKGIRAYVKVFPTDDRLFC